MAKANKTYRDWKAYLVIVKLMLDTLPSAKEIREELKRRSARNGG